MHTQCAGLAPRSLSALHARDAARGSTGPTGSRGTSTSIVDVGRSSDGGRGLFLTQDMPVEASGSFLTLPLTHALCVPSRGEGEGASSSSWFRDYLQGWQQAHRVQLPGTLDSVLHDEAVAVSSKLVAWLLWALRHVPYFQAYVALLPDRTAASSMVRASPAHLAALHDPRARGLAERIQQQALEQCEVLKERLGAAGCATDDSLLAFDLVKSRTFAAHWENEPTSAGGSRGSGSPVGVYAPIADFANHRFAANAEFALAASTSRPESGADAPAAAARRFVLRRRRGVGALSAGTEVVVSYGDTLDNAHLLSSYGFVLQGNPNDRIPSTWLEPPCRMRPALLARAADEVAAAAPRDEAHSQRVYCALASIVHASSQAPGGGSSGSILQAEADACAGMLCTLQPHLAALAALVRGDVQHACPLMAAVQAFNTEQLAVTRAGASLLEEWLRMHATL